MPGPPSAFVDPAIAQYAGRVGESSPYAEDGTSGGTGAATGPGTDPATTGSDLPPQQDVDELLRRKRKAREHKACYPCRQRKVKCDLSRPCQTCRDRDHPELCSYHPPNKRQDGRQDSTAGNGIIKVEDTGNTSNSVTLGRDQFDLLCRKLNGLENSIAELRRELQRNSLQPPPSTGSAIRRQSDASFHHSPSGTFFQSPQMAMQQSPHSSFHLHPDAAGIDPRIEQSARRPTHIDIHGLHTRNDAGDIVHVGGSSIPAMLYALGDDHTEGSPLQEMLGKSALPLFGLDNESATYPFVDLWGIPHGSLARAKGISTALPQDDQMLKLIRTYKEMGYLVFPSIVDPDQLEMDAHEFLAQRAKHAATDDGVTEREIYGKSYTWLALLFSVLASGAQSSIANRRQRELTSQVYICSGFECLRFTNFISLANLESVQALVVIGHVLTNNMNAGTAWSFHGLTIRVAQSLGLHQASPPSYTPDVVLPRSKIWWSIIWLDSLLSIGYDRPSSAYYEISSMPMPQYVGKIRPYHSAMYELSKIALSIVRDRSVQMSPQEKYDRIVAHRDAIGDLMSNVAEHLRNSRHCNGPRETIEHWGFYLHTSYNLAELFRPAISPNADPQLAQDFRQPCVDNLIQSVEAYLGLHNITSFTKNSWAALQRGLSSSLLLGILGEHSRNERALRLVSQFQAVLQDITDNVDAQEVSAPVRRALSALRRLKLSEVSFFPDGSSNLALKMEYPTVITPASSSEANGHMVEEPSPHSLLNSILWGHDPSAMSGVEALRR